MNKIKRKKNHLLRITFTFILEIILLVLILPVSHSYYIPEIFFKRSLFFDPVSLKVTGLTLKQLSKVRVYRTNSKNEISEVKIIKSNKDYFNDDEAYQKIIIFSSSEIGEKMKSIELLVGNKNYLFRKQDLINNWHKLDREFNNQKIDNQSFVIETDLSGINRPILIKALSKLLRLPDIFNWRSNLNIIFLLVIIIFLSILICLTLFLAKINFFASKNFFIFTVVVLFLKFWLADFSKEVHLLNGSQVIVINAIDQSLSKGINFAGGFMGTYYSQYGLHYKIFAFIAGISKLNLAITNFLFRLLFGGLWKYTIFYRLISLSQFQLETFIYLTRLLVGLSLAMTLGMFISTVKKEWGRLSAVTSFLCLLLSPLIASSSFNLYWIIFSHFLPFIFSFVFYPKLQKQKIFSFFYLTIGLLIFLKSLCGYEYITNITLSAIVPVIYYELKKKTKLKTVLTKIWMTFLSGVIGFILAISLHFLQGLLYFHSFNKAFEVIANRAIGRTYGDVLGPRPPLTKDLLVFISYLKQNAWLNISHESMMLAVLFTVLLLFIMRLIFPSIKKKFSKVFLPVIFILISSLIASLSWEVFGLGHMRHHLSFNGIIFYLPFHLVATAVLPFIYYQLIILIIKNKSKKKSSNEN